VTEWPSVIHWFRSGTKFDFFRAQRPAVDIAVNIGGIKLTNAGAAMPSTVVEYGQRELAGEGHQGIVYDLEPET
jgi:hypothetical protein